MPISEKTVELNVSRTVVEKLRRFHQRQVYALGATQAQEAAFGFDVEVTDGLWSAGVIQYKRLYVEPKGVHLWHLNRTAARDQHSLLLTLEAAGFLVLYCFPKFDDENTLRRWTPPSLWSQVWWVKPSSIPVPDPVDTFHKVRRTPSGVWTVSSEKPVEFDDPSTDFDVEFSHRLASRSDKHTLRELKAKLNKELYRRSVNRRPDSDARQRRYAASTLSGTQIIGLGPTE
jgi:hypothetical protein